MFNKFILETLEVIDNITSSNFFKIVTSDYYTSYRILRRLDYAFPEKKTKEQLARENLRKFYSALSKLKKQGFIQKVRRDAKSYWRITNLGREKLSFLKSDAGRPFLKLLPVKAFNKEKDDNLNMVIFDIPEKERFKRHWLRTSLISLDFFMLQKSVWVGKNKIPEEFIKGISDLKLLEKVHIFKVAKSSLGTLPDLN